jgi:hypothetical protein
MLCGGNSAISLRCRLISLSYLPWGLHREPDQLRIEVQDAVDFAANC